MTTSTSLLFSPSSASLSSLSSSAGTPIQPTAFTPNQPFVDKHDDAFRKEWGEYLEIQRTICNEFAEINSSSKTLFSRQKGLRSTITEQMKQGSRLLSLCDNDPDVKQEIELWEQRNRQFSRQLLNDGGPFVRMFLGKVNSVVLTGHEKRRYEFKEEYEKFKMTYTIACVPLAVLMLFFRNRLLDTLYQMFLSYFYMTLAMRENILRVNGSNIKQWWITHHYLSIILVLTMLTWPQSPVYDSYRFWFYLYAVYSGIVQVLQYNYQDKKLYKKKTLGQANAMDTASSDSAVLLMGSELAFLLPFIFAGHFLQLCNAFYLFKKGFESWGNSEWQIFAVGIEFLTLAVGNIYTTIIVSVNHYRRKKRKRQAAIEAAEQRKNA